MLLINRGEIVQAVVNLIRKEIQEFQIVRPYQGEIDRYEKRGQIKSATFPAEVSLTTPFALVISKDRKPLEESKNRTMKLEHLLSIYVGVSNTHEFQSTKIPDAFWFLGRCVDVLNEQVLHTKAAGLKLVSDGEYLITTDLFTVYDQKWVIPEIGK